MNQEIKRIAWEQLQKSGASNLSLRAISREMNMTSSALYRYFKNRDALLTELIIDAYNNIGELVEENDAQIPAKEYHQRFISIGQTILEWGEDSPHRFFLVYGPPIPGYSAPTDTIDPGTRTQMTLYRLLGQWGADQQPDNSEPAPTIPAKLDHQLREAAKTVGIAAPAHVIIAGMAHWSELMGIVYSHFFNHFGQELADGEISQWLIRQMAWRIFGPETN